MHTLSLRHNILWPRSKVADHGTMRIHSIKKPAPTICRAKLVKTELTTNALLLLFITSQHRMRYVKYFETIEYESFFPSAFELHINDVCLTWIRRHVLAILRITKSNNKCNIMKIEIFFWMIKMHCISFRYRLANGLTNLKNACTAVFRKFIQVF